MPIEVNTDSNNNIEIEVEAGQGNASVVLQNQSQAIGAIGTTALYGPKGDKGDKGEQGEQGIQGETGNGIEEIEKTSTEGLNDTYTITYTDGSTSTFTVTNGNGIVNIAKTSTSGLTDTYTITFDNGTTTTYTVTNGEKGNTGEQGIQGIQGVQGVQGEQGVSVTGVTLQSVVGLQKTYRMTFSNATNFDYVVLDGAAGATTWGGISGVLSNQADLQNELDNKQNTLTPGTNIQINGNTISATDTTYTAGTGISISNGVISNTQTSAEWGNIEGTLSDQTDLQTALNAKYDASNPNGYTSNVGTVTSVNNISPVDGNVTLTMPDPLPDQTGNANKFLTTDGMDASWAAVPARNIGEVVTSTIPLTDAGLHLLDGALIDGNGIYGAFVDYIADLYGDGSAVPAYFTDETSWQTSVTTYGVCGKFVYDSDNNTVRLPKITGIIEGTTDVTALGDLVQAGLPNITGEVYDTTYPLWAGYASDTQTTGSFYKSRTLTAKQTVTVGSGNCETLRAFAIDASRSSSVYGNSSTVQPQAIKGFLYIVIANTTKTAIQVDIDNIATDLNGKTDIDLTNVTDTGHIKMATANMPGSKYINLTLGANGATYTAPADGYILFNKKVTEGTWQYISMSNLVSHIGARCFSNSANAGAYLPVLKGEQFQVWYNASGAVNYFRLVYAVGSESEAL